MSIKKMLEKVSGTMILFVVFLIYFVLDIKTPEILAFIIDSLIGRIILLIITIYLVLYSNPILAVLFILIAYTLIRRSSDATGIDALQKYAPSEEKKMSQFTAFNQFPYTLEQEVVSNMAPLTKTGFSLSSASYKPNLDNTYDASPAGGQ